MPQAMARAAGPATNKSIADEPVVRSAESRCDFKVSADNCGAGEPDHVVESITGHLSRRMLEHYSHIRLNGKRAALDRLEQSGKAATLKNVK
jgi:hypothetical protein